MLIRCELWMPMHVSREVGKGYVQWKLCCRMAWTVFITCINAVK